MVNTMPVCQWDRLKKKQIKATEFQTLKQPLSRLSIVTEFFFFRFTGKTRETLFLVDGTKESDCFEPCLSTKVESFSWKTTSHKDHLEVCLYNSRLLPHKVYRIEATLQSEMVDSK